MNNRSSVTYIIRGVMYISELFTPYVDNWLCIAQNRKFSPLFPYILNVYHTNTKGRSCVQADFEVDKVTFGNHTNCDKNI